jgi:ABC-type molybdate transport system substrate-binding protein
MKSDKIKFIFISILCVVVLLGSVYFISATSTGTPLGPETVITGKVFYADNNQPVDGAKVIVKCGLARTETKTAEDGTYYFNLLKRQCEKNHSVTVNANKNGITGAATKLANGEEIDLFIGTTPVVPEFGAFAGVVTVLGAVGTFFVIRKKQNVKIKRRF